MKKLKQDFKQGSVTLLLEHLDDVWWISQLLHPGDILSGKSYRKIKTGKEDERSSAAVKKPVFLHIRVEKVEYTPSFVRASGKVEEGTEDVPKGSYHSFQLEPGSALTITKSSWLSYQKKQLEQACKAKPPLFLLVAHDREEAYFAIMKQYGYEILSILKGDVAKKQEGHSATGSFYAQVINQIKQYDEKYHPEKIILASPSFFKEDLIKECKETAVKKKIILATCSYVGKTSFDEILKREETKQALAEDRIRQEMKLVDQLLQEISKDEKAAYGLSSVQEAAAAGAIETLLVTDTFLNQMREQQKGNEIEKIMRSVDQTKGNVHIISAEHDGGKKLQGLGGIAALLRYKMKY